LIILQTEAGWKYISSNHHIVLDGWSRAIVQQEVFAIYRSLSENRAIELPPFQPFSDYVAWTRTRDIAATQARWQDYLAGFTTPSSLVEAKGIPGATLSGSYARQVLQLAPSTNERLQGLTQAAGLTANTIMQGAWALLTTHYTKQQDVVMGVISSGRPSALADVDTIVGLCINVLPVRTRVEAGVEASAWLADMQGGHAELRELDFTPLSTIEKWCAGGERLFDTIFVFENYPWDGSLETLADSLDTEHPLSNTNYQKAQFEFPLRVEVAPKRPLLVVQYYQSCFLDTTVKRMLLDWAAMIKALVTAPNATLGDVLGRFAGYCS
jgi:hypothetical protein